MHDATISVETTGAPVIEIGMPRSGTSILFEALCTHPDLAWLSQYVTALPRFGPVHALARLADRHPRLRRRASRWERDYSLLDRVRIGPSEAIGLWWVCCGRQFQRSYLLDARPTPAQAECVRRTFARARRWQRRPRVAAKLTGPGRVGYIGAIFPDARFVHVIRDARAVTHSLMNVGFWKDNARETEPAWRGGTDPALLERWRQTGGGPIGLAAIQWASVVRTTRAEAAAHAPGRYLEVRFEDFTARPQEVLNDVFEFCGLAPAGDLRGAPVRPVRETSERWRDELSAGERALIWELVGDLLTELGYEEA